MAMASSEKPESAAMRASWLTGLWRSFARSWTFILFFLGFFLFWEYAIDLFSIPAYILPRPSEIVTRGWADIDKLLYYTYVTGLESLLGYLVAIVVAVPFGLAIAFSSFLRRTIYPFFVSLEMTPKIAFAPLFISWLGFGLLPKVIIVFLVCFFPVVLNAILAFGSLSEELTRFIRATGASPLRAFFKVRLPAALPSPAICVPTSLSPESSC
jgi:NitT/TauT family transport system permease protein